MTNYVNPPSGLPTFTPYTSEKKRIGKCSVCGGDVVIPTAWMGTFAPRGRCLKCGRRQKDNLPNIEME